MWKNCHFHNGELLQNFCSSRTCSIPLCPKCINIHLCQPISHKILALEDVISSTLQCVNTCIIGLQQQSNFLESQMNTLKVHEQFANLIQKSRKQNIEQINQYYKTLSQEILTKIQASYNQCIYATKVSLEQELNKFHKYLNELKNQKTVISALITINSSDQVQKIQQLFIQCKQKRQIFKDYLPRLQPDINGKLYINNVRPMKKQQFIEGFPSHSRYRHDRIDRIASLEEKLLLVRTRAI